MSGTFPSSPAPFSVTLESFEPSYKTTAHSLRRIVRSRGAQRWMFILKWPSMTRTEFSPLYAWLVSQAGEAGTFTFYPPEIGVLQGTGAGVPLVKTTTTAGLQSVPSKGWTAWQTVLKAGDFLKFASHAKVYMATADVVADGSGEATIALRPGLLSQVAANEAITVSNVPFTCAVDGDTLEAEMMPAQRVQLAELHLLEVP